MASIAYSAADSTPRKAASATIMPTPRPGDVIASTDTASIGNAARPLSMKMETPSKNSMKNSASTKGTRIFAAKSIFARPR
ncbi:hypothetical protein D3C85_1448560 [compost metagenome]